MVATCERIGRRCVRVHVSVEREGCASEASLTVPIFERLLRGGESFCGDKEQFFSRSRSSSLRRSVSSNGNSTMECVSVSKSTTLRKRITNHCWISILTTLHRGTTITFESRNRRLCMEEYRSLSSLEIDDFASKELQSELLSFQMNDFA